MKINRVGGNGRRALRVVDPREDFADESPVDLSDARVAILGCGSLGGFAAWGLASAGVGSLHLADCDRLSNDNVRRHVCGESDVGCSKTASLAGVLRDRFPHLEVHRHDDCFLKKPDQVREVLDECEIALVAIDREGPKYVVNDMLFCLRRAAVFAGVYGGGWGAEFVLVDPDRGTSCYGCAANTLGRAGIGQEHADAPPPYSLATNRGSTARHAHRSTVPIAVADSDDKAISPHNDMNQWMQADLTSIMPAAGMAADLVTAWLDANRGSKRRLDEFMRQGASAWRLAIRHVPAWQLGPWNLQRIMVDGNTACPQKCAVPHADLACSQTG